MKKGALELSASAIVILILAIVMLGLALGFVRGMFGKATTSFEELISAEPEPSAPSGGEPLTLSKEVIVTRAKEDVVLKVAAYNPSNVDWTNTAPVLNCASDQVINIIQVNNRTVRQGETQSYNVLVSIKSSAPPGSYLCDASVNESVKDFTIKIKK